MMHGTETRKHHNSIVAIAMYKYISLLLIIVASFVHFEPSKPGFFSKSLCMYYSTAAVHHVSADHHDHTGHFLER